MSELGIKKDLIKAERNALVEFLAKDFEQLEVRNEFINIKVTKKARASIKVSNCVKIDTFAVKACSNVAQQTTVPHILFERDWYLVHLCAIQEKGYGMRIGMAGWACKKFITQRIQAHGYGLAAAALHLLDNKGKARASGRHVLGQGKE